MGKCMKIAFIGLGHMGFPMAKNLLTAGHTLKVFDLNPNPVDALAKLGATPCPSAINTLADAEIVISIVPEGEHVRALYGGPEGILDHIPHEATMPEGILDHIPHEATIVECSTVDITTTRWLHDEADKRGVAMVDAPVSGGVTGAENATLTFMVGGEESDFTQVEPILNQIGKKIVHCGPAGTGQAAKICNNMVLGATMIASSEAFILAEKLGLSKEKFFEVVSGSSAQNWSITSYCPVPGPVPTSPANRDYEAGFTAAMMLKDLKLAVDAAQTTNSSCPMGAEAMSLYNLFCNTGESGKDFSGIIQWIARRDFK
jgi:3-hydroxyisobutyrate dehydrogenase